MSAVGIAVPFAHAATELALKSPSADVTLRPTDDALVAVGADRVGVDVSTKTVNGPMTVVTAGDSLSVALNMTVFRPAVSITGIDQVTLCSDAVDTWYHCAVPTLYPMVAMSLVGRPSDAFAVPMKIVSREWL